MAKENSDLNAYTVRKPSKLLYWLLVPPAKLAAQILFGFKVVKDPEIKKINGPLIAIGTHSSAMDVGFMMVSLIPRPLNIVCGRDVMSWKPVKPIFERAGLIPISQFAVDVGSIRMMKRAVDSGLSLSIFPEGKISIDGRNLHYLAPSLAKLVKFLDVPVVMIHNNGGYCSRPRWHHGIKHGKVVQVQKLLFTKEDLKRLSNAEIYEKLKGAFSFNDHVFQEDNKIRFKSKKPALGLNYILYKCPKCGKEYTIISNNNELICEACGNIVSYSEYGKLAPVGTRSVCPYDRIDKWYDWERSEVRKELEGDDFFVSHEVVWEICNPKNNYFYEPAGDGELYIDKENMGFKGTDLRGKSVEISIPLKQLATVVQKLEEAIDLTINGVVNRFYFRDCKYSAKYNLIVEENFDMKS